MTRHIKFDLSLIDDRTPTYFRFRVLLNGEGLWPTAGNDQHVEVFVDDILDYLADFWTPLLLRQTYPLDFVKPPERPSAIQIEAASRWLEFSERQIEVEQSRVAAFEEAHNMALCFGGQFALPPFWLLRERDKMIIDTGERLEKVDFYEVVAALKELGDEIAQRLTNSRIKHALVAAWEARSDIDGIRMVELRTGLSAKKAEELVRMRYLVSPNNLVDAANDNDEIVMAARMAGALPLEDIKRIIKLSKSFVHRPSRALDRAGKRIRDELAQKEGMKPFDQGELAARILRLHMEIDRDEPVDVHALLSELGVEVRENALSLEGLIGLAICGNRYGPGVLINKRSRHLLHATETTRQAMMRYTLAHELCHLLVDGEHSLGAVDVLRGRMAPAIESRAQSFAGELLLPTRFAKAVWQSEGSPITGNELDAVVAQAALQFKVTRSVAAWKIEHGAREDDIDLHHQLDAVARYR